MTAPLMFDLSVEIARPPEEVFAFLADVQRSATRPGVRALLEEPGG